MRIQIFSLFRQEIIAQEDSPGFQDLEQRIANDVRSYSYLFVENEEAASVSVSAPQNRTNEAACSIIITCEGERLRGTLPTLWNRMIRTIESTVKAYRRIADPEDARPVHIVLVEPPASSATP